jgi:hypothetical protein
MREERSIVMLKLKITSEALSGARLDFFKEGIFRNTAGVTLEMAGKPLTFDEVGRIIGELQSMSLPKSRIVRFCGALSDGDPNFILLVKALYDYNYTIQCETQNGRIYSWFQWCSWIIIRTSDHVVLTTANEVWYTPSDLDVIEDLVLPPAPKPAFLFLGGRLEMTKALEFMCRTRQSWALL